MIDFNVAVELNEDDPKIKGYTGLKEWSAPETRQKQYNDCKIDCWTLGCIMHLLCTGEQPFKSNCQIDMTPKFNLLHKMMDYCESESFAEMVDFISKLLVNDPEKRLSAKEALSHPWLNAKTYKEN